MLEHKTMPKYYAGILVLAGRQGRVHMHINNDQSALENETVYVHVDTHDLELFSIS